MADDPAYQVPYRGAPRVYRSLSGYLQSVAHYGPPLAPSALPSKVAAAKAAAAKAEAAKQQREETAQKKTWIEIELVGEDGTTPIPGKRYVLELPDGTKRQGSLDFSGRARIADLEPGATCKLTFPDLDQDAWVRA
jgi:hypothetical protein